jgi:hypothetical protein
MPPCCYTYRYRTELKDSRRRIATGVKRLEGGLTKLGEAAAAVDQMQASTDADETELIAVLSAAQQLQQVLIRFYDSYHQL